MIISVNWLKKYVDIDLPIDQLATLIGSRLVEIERVIDLGDKYKDVVIAKVVYCEKLEKSNHLHFCKIDDGGAVQDVPRDENDHIQVVCGAPNVHDGMLAAWLPPRAIVPDTYDTAEPFTLSAKKLMGVMSNGMLASPRELDLYDDHSGILEIDPSSTAIPGGSFAELYQLNDYLLDIENKSLTHRPDTFGILGFAREVAAIQGRAFRTPDWLNQTQPVFDIAQDNAIENPTVTIEDSTACPRYQLAVLSLGDNSKTPNEVKLLLARSGVRPVSPIVDVTNYMMLLTGQPLHAFDYDKLLDISHGIPDMTVRLAREGETLELIGGKKIDLATSDIVVTTDNVPVSLAGAMGGASTAIDDHTQRIALESATFDLHNLRQTQMRHGIFSEAITRFTKGQSTTQTAPVLAEAIRLLGEWSGSVTLQAVAQSDYQPEDKCEIRVALEFINQILASHYSYDAVKTLLENVEMSVKHDGDDLIITPPYWRSDINIKQDIVEEVGRINGFDNIPTSLPRRDVRAVLPTAMDNFERRLRNALTETGLSEALSYSFIPGSLIKTAQQKTDDAYRIVNSISPDLQYYRLSLLPSLLKLVYTNSKLGYDQFGLYELNKIHARHLGLDDDAVPEEQHNVAGVVYDKHRTNGAAYYLAKRVVDYVAIHLNVPLRYVPMTKYDVASDDESMLGLFEPKRSAVIMRNDSDVLLGVVGEIRSVVSKKLKLPQQVAGFEFNVELLFQLYSATPDLSYYPSSKFPAVDRDICFRVPLDVQYDDVLNAISDGLAQSNVMYTVEPVDIYRGKDQITKNITVRLHYTPYQQTLDGERVKHLVELSTGIAKDRLKAEII